MGSEDRSADGSAPTSSARRKFSVQPDSDDGGRLGGGSEERGYDDVGVNHHAHQALSASGLASAARTASSMNLERSPPFMPCEPRKARRVKSVSFETLMFQRTASSSISAIQLSR